MYKCIKDVQSDSSKLEQREQTPIILNMEEGANVISISQFAIGNCSSIV
jgi:hypothetical protein